MKTALAMVCEDCEALRELEYPGVPPVSFLNLKEAEITEFYSNGMRVSDISDMMISLYRLHLNLAAH